MTGADVPPIADYGAACPRCDGALKERYCVACEAWTGAPAGRRSWSQAEVERLVWLREHDGATWPAIAAVLDRTWTACRGRYLRAVASLPPNDGSRP